ncbi:ABC transporter ATP-binding protein [Corynebacterium choanae]|uniref:ABC transporter ATP-binding protein YxdL n=1 Tax=Corynebacterium choanae TaxID=1862358 RepID=A0A3G6J379_9CORY|nr:ABC transporter ATP-binding protein [Corynebacterium choanae]AZA12531.1 ABC transporter ATP-binding protein YxdL [Corynebacterium choanae]
MTQPHPAFALETSDVSKTFGRGSNAVQALRQVSVQLPAGQWTALMGPSGSGKTTLLHVLAGLATPDSGSVLLHPSAAHPGSVVDVASLSDAERTKLRRTRIGVIFQEFNLVPVLSVRDNIRLPMRLAHQRIDEQRFSDIVTRLGLGDRLRHTPAALSGGQRQRVAVARALLSQPDVLLADEPTGNLDSRTSEAVLGLFREIVDTFGVTVAMVTHDPQAAAVADRTIHMVDGVITTPSTAGIVEGAQRNDAPLPHPPRFAGEV